MGICITFWKRKVPNTGFILHTSDIRVVLGISSFLYHHPFRYFVQTRKLDSGEVHGRRAIQTVAVFRHKRWRMYPEIRCSTVSSQGQNRASQSEHHVRYGFFAFQTLRKRRGNYDYIRLLNPRTFQTYVRTWTAPRGGSIWRDFIPPHRSLTTPSAPNLKVKKYENTQM